MGASICMGLIWHASLHIHRGREETINCHRRVLNTWLSSTRSGITIAAARTLQSTFATKLNRKEGEGSVRPLSLAPNGCIVCQFHVLVSCLCFMLGKERPGGLRNWPRFESARRGNGFKCIAAATDGLSRKESGRLRRRRRTEVCPAERRLRSRLQRPWDSSTHGLFHIYPDLAS